MLSRNITALLLVAAALASKTSPVPDFDARTAQSDCRKPEVRKSWTALTTAEQKAYIDAELCLMKLPANETLDIRGAKTKFDELQSVHVNQAEGIHFVGQFLPWHRYFLHAHEYQLKTYCSYNGAQPYWDEIADANDFINSALFQPDAFGGDGGGSCITSGPFKNYSVAIGPGYNIQPGCITRKIAGGLEFQQGVEPIVINTCLNHTNFIDFWYCIESGPHPGGHGGVQGLMIDVLASPGDPVFYMHHAFLDKIWAEWQSVDPAQRLYQVGGNNHVNLTHPYALGSPIVFEGLNITISFPLSVPSLNATNLEFILGQIFGAQRPADLPPPEVLGDPALTTTLSHALQSYGIIPDATIADIMDTTGGYLCYTYL